MRDRPGSECDWGKHNLHPGKPRRPLQPSEWGLTHLALKLSENGKNSPPPSPSLSPPSSECTFFMNPSSRTLCFCLMLLTFFNHLKSNLLIGCECGEACTPPLTRGSYAQGREGLSNVTALSPVAERRRCRTVRVLLTPFTDFRYIHVYIFLLIFCVFFY